MFLLKGTRAFRIIVLLAACMGALTSCERKGTSEPVRAALLDPRVLKEFGENGSWFCAMEIEYSEESESQPTTRKLLVSTADKKTSMTTRLSANCASEKGAGKILCSQKLENKTYPCVHESLFTPHAAPKSIWQCRMEYSVPEAETALLLVTGKEGETVQETISAAFSQCAEVNDDQTEVMRDACARAMIEKKMTCTDLMAPGPPPVRTKRPFR